MSFIWYWEGKRSPDLLLTQKHCWILELLLFLEIMYNKNSIANNKKLFWRLFKLYWWLLRVHSSAAEAEWKAKYSHLYCFYSDDATHWQLLFKKQCDNDSLCKYNTEKTNCKASILWIMHLMALSKNVGLNNVYCLFYFQIF